VEIRTTAGDDNQNKILYSVAAYWERIGVGVDPVIVPAQQSQDRQYMGTRPGFTLSGGRSGLLGLENFHSRQAPGPENGWSGTNTPRYRSPEYDALYERYLVTVPRAPRVQVLGEILLHLATELPVLPVYYRVAPSLLSNRLEGARGVPFEGAQVWNVQTWDVKR
jgi:peptide/nickel transport system substrate-binding protein